MKLKKNKHTKEGNDNSEQLEVIAQPTGAAGVQDGQTQPKSKKKKRKRK